MAVDIPLTASVLGIVVNVSSDSLGSFVRRICRGNTSWGNLAAERVLAIACYVTGLSSNHGRDVWVVKAESCDGKVLTTSSICLI